MQEPGAPLHDPAPPEPRRLLPEGATAVRGLALAGVALVSLWAANRSLKLSWLALPLSVLLAAAGLLAAWAAAIHLTGGEKFDDHPWV